MHTVMEAGKSHSPPSVGWRTRKASDVIQSDSEGLRIWGQSVVTVPVPVCESENERDQCPKAGDGGPRSNRGSELALHLPFHSPHALDGWEETHTGDGDLLYLVC